MRSQFNRGGKKKELGAGGMAKRKAAVPVERIERSILLIRGQRVMLDANLATLYGVETKQLKRGVRRNINRFPKDFMFQLTEDEFGDLRSQFGTSSWGGTRYMPMAFTEQGVAMLSSVLNSERAERFSRRRTQTNPDGFVQSVRLVKFVNGCRWLKNNRWY